MEGKEVPKVVMGRLTGRHLVMRFGLDSVNKVWELHGILNEEYRDIVSTEGCQIGGVITSESSEAYPTISQFPSGV